MSGRGVHNSADLTCYGCTVRNDPRVSLIKGKMEMNLGKLVHGHWIQGMGGRMCVLLLVLE